jgi:16S rRNA (adenine1518-N6/adenine1519-N6)-dimethyltransferase
MTERHHAKKRLGQHFLKDEAVIEQIVRCIAPTPSQSIVEIGPGLGALTKRVLPLVNQLDVIEFDRDVIPLLKKACDNDARLIVHQADVLTFDLSSLVTGDNKLRVIGNLPYNISTPIFFHLVSFIDHIQDMHFMLQKEVVDRMCASVGTKKYGRLTVMLQYYCEAEFLFDVPPTAFAPPPKVDSAVLRLVPHKKKPCEAEDVKQFSIVVRTAFNQRRKTLRNTLKKLMSEETLKQLSINPQQRPEVTTLQEFVRISNALTSGEAS